MRLFSPHSITAIILLVAQTGLALHNSPPDSSGDGADKVVRVAPGPEYDAHSFHKLLWGEHWRDMWKTEFTAEVLDLDTFAGGLTPTKKGGSLQTLNLRFIGNDGREYKFRSLNKDGKRTLPLELQESIVADIYQDQISIGNPMAAVVVPTLLDAVGVLNTLPRIFVMPKSDRLGEFREEFAGVLGTIEEHPRAGKKHDPGFKDAEDIINGFEIFEVLAANPDNRIDEVEFLKARFMDVLVGDRDRHADQWRWAKYTVNGRHLWRPIPRDRDFAFGRYDGLFPWAAGLVAHSAVGFGENYPSILELTWIGRHLDRRFLSELDRPVWDSVAAFIRSTLTDSVLQRAINAMPPEMYQTAGDKMLRMLKSRRGKLGEAADEFYTLVSNVVDVYGSDESERAIINRLDDSHVQVRLLKKKSDELLFNRTFSSIFTSELRIHLLGGDDVATVEGNGDGRIRIRIIGGDGEDELADHSRTGRTEFFDDINTNIIAGPKSSVELGKEDSSFSERIPEPTTEDRYGVWKVLPLLSFTSDDGFIAGGYVDRTQYGFRVRPYGEFTEMTARYAPRFSHYDVHFMTESYRVITNARVELLVDAGNLGLSGFYGLGNETIRDKTLAAADFYRANYHTIRVEPAVNIPISASSILRFGVRYEYSNANVEPNTLLDQVKPYGLGIHSNLAVDARWTYDGRDPALAPTKGLFFSTGGAFYPALFRNEDAFGTTYADARVYFPVIKPVIFAMHIGGEKIFGSHPFTHAALLGGVNTVRGFSRDRFAGDASVYAQAEMRVSLARVNFFVPSMLGVTFFDDAGRVFLTGEASRKWHSAYGGGVWLNAVNMFVLNFSVARSTEETRFYLMSGFGF